MAHMLRECNSTPSDVKDGRVEAQYGEWLKASGPDRKALGNRRGRASSLSGSRDRGVLAMEEDVAVVGDVGDRGL